MLSYLPIHDVLMLVQGMYDSRIDDSFGGSEGYPVLHEVPVHSTPAFAALPKVLVELCRVHASTTEEPEIGLVGSSKIVDLTIGPPRATLVHMHTAKLELNWHCAATY